MKTALFACLNALAAGWAVNLVRLHNDAVAKTLVPGVLCGEDGGCGDVLASQWSTIAGIPVSAPAAPMYAALAILGLIAMSGKLSAARLSGLAVLCGTAGVAFGGWLLFHMLVSVGAVCNYCLVMDGLNLAVLLSGAALHPGGFKAAFSAIPAALSRLVRPGPEAILIPAVLAGAFAIHAAMPAPDGPSEADITAAVEAATASVAPPVAVAGVAEKTGETRRVVLTDDIKEILIGEGVPVLGPEDAPVTIVLFEDFQCPFCRTLAGNLHALKASRPDDVRIAWYNFPMHTACNAAAPKDMHPRACAAAAASVCAEQQGKFWEMHDVLFFNSAKLSNKEILNYAEGIGVDMSAYKTCLRDPATGEKILADARLGAELGVKGTPTFFINGRRLSGAQPVEVLEAVVDRIKEGTEGSVRMDIDLLGEVVGAVGDVPATVTLSGPYGAFTIDAFESTIVDGVAVSRSGAEVARGVSWYDASAACEAAGKRLCTEEEWLTACTGSLPSDVDGDGTYSDDPILGRRHPYGAYPQSSWCASAREKDDDRPLITGEHPRCATPDGVYDLEGLTKEWIGLSPDRAGVKGGSYYSRGSARCGYLKDSIPPDEADPSIGFRCCQGAAPVTEGERLPGGKVGDTVQSWQLTTLDGQPFDSAQLSGKAHVITFWASWCGPCRKELPVLADLYTQYGDQGFSVVGINIDQEPAKARAFLKQNPMPFPSVADSDSALMNRFDAESLPTAFWVTASGEIRQKTTGFDERKAAELEEFVQSLLEH
ncbi:MAG: protein-disulfide isomerase/uncharacterized membrane protein/thiol-disulfide isomerase/thioredoxin [Myxococcota bacterium]|jgi:protein-disulfide isomerase/uncharacterized membrane protein/thiol-disulfide isomerase/thioredoxin